MELELSLSRRFREDTLSDLVIASFLQLPSTPVAILTPNEARTGSDFDLELVDPASNTTICYRIQAKRLGRPTVNWRHRSYHHLAHPKDTGGQATTLCDASNLAGPIPTIPIYAFFNHETVCAASGVPGISLADAFEIEAHIKGSLTIKPRPLFRRISSVQHLFFGLETILCPPSSGSGRGLATPQESRDTFERIVNVQRVRRSQGEGAVVKDIQSRQPGIAQPEQLQALREQEGRRVRTAAIERPRVIVATGEPI
jgi:hypothetical protein